jgi:hypothetical protein
LLIGSSCGCCFPCPCLFIAFSCGAITDCDDKDLLLRLLAGAIVGPEAPPVDRTSALLLSFVVVICCCCCFGGAAILATALDAAVVVCCFDDEDDTADVVGGIAVDNEGIHMQCYYLYELSINKEVFYNIIMLIYILEDTYDIYI